MGHAETSEKAENIFYDLRKHMMKQIHNTVKEIN